jgi:MHS family proline/betaine transporter-like MFS transporter
LDDPRRALIAACIGNLVEWYDFALYGAFATVLAAT